MYEKAIETLKSQAASLDETNPTEADNIREAADLLKHTDPGENRGDVAISISAIEGSAARALEKSGLKCFSLVSVPFENIREGDGFYHDQLAAAGMEEGTVGAFHAVHAPKAIATPASQDPRMMVDLSTRFQSLVYNSLLVATPPELEPEATDEEA